MQTTQSDAYSHSRLSTFETCPRKFHFRYVLRMRPETESIEGFLGKRVHEVLERLYLFAGRGQVPALSRVVARFRQMWADQYDADRVRIVRDDLSAEFYREYGERCLTNYYRRHYPFDGDETLGIEERVNIDLDGTGTYRIRGIVDRIVRARDRAIEIHDYKTGRRIPRQEELDRDRQLALYQMALTERYDTGQPVRLVWHYLLADQVRTSSRSPEQLAELRDRTIGLIDRIRSETEWEPRPGPLCRWCEYRDVCPANPDRQRSAPAPAPNTASPSNQLDLLGRSDPGEAAC